MPNDKANLSFDLFKLERTIAQRKLKVFEEQLIELIIFIDNKHKLESQLSTMENGDVVYTHKGLYPLHNLMPLEEKQNIYSRLAATISSYLSDSHFSHRDDVLTHLIIFKSYISDIFYLSCYENMDHILFNRGLLNENLQLNLQTELDIKFLYSCLTLNTHINFDTKLLVEALPKFGQYWYLGMLYGHQHSYNNRIEQNFNAIFDAHSLIQTMQFDTTAIELSLAPWMLCSYLDRNDRHEMKASINKAMENWVNTKHIGPGTKKKIERYITKTKTIKKIVVLSEQYKSTHAMYRCYHPELKNLKEHFHVTCLADPERYDELSSKDFDQIINISDTTQDLSNIISQIVKVEPDLILFPSLGMAKWTIPLANLRLAKHQIMCYGHPASAFSEYIDFSYCSEPRPDQNFQQFCMEKIVPIYRGREFTWEPHPEYVALDIQKPNDGVVRIAINSSLPKITPRFIHMCQLLIEHSSVPIEFNFFLLSHDLAFEKSVIARLNGAIKVHPPTNYMAYMKTLSTCDLAIGTFPFGGSNTNTDLALLGIPKVFYSEACGLASFSDQIVLEKLNPPDILTPKSEGELISNLIYLIHDNVMRNELSNTIKNSNPYDLFYKQKTNKNAKTNSELVSAIHWIEDNGSTTKMNTPSTN